MKLSLIFLSKSSVMSPFTIVSSGTSYLDKHRIMKTCILQFHIRMQFIFYYTVYSHNVIMLMIIQISYKMLWCVFCLHCLMRLPSVLECKLALKVRWHCVTAFFCHFFLQVLELLEVFQFRSPDISMKYSEFMTNLKYDLRVRLYLLKLI